MTNIIIRATFKITSLYTETAFKSFYTEIHSIPLRLLCIRFKLN